MTLQDPSPRLSERQAQILAIVEGSGFATIEALAERFGVSAQTVRRDIIALSDSGRLQRFHGGAGPVARHEATRLDYRAKRDIARPEKQLIGKMAAERVPDGATLYLDVGTTVEACASYLGQRQGFTVFTNSMPAAMKFDPKDHQVVVLGGKMAGRDGSLVGTAAVETLKSVNLDVALIACSAIDDAGRVMDFDLDKIAIKQAAMAAAGQSLLLATRSKFGRSALAVVARRAQFAAILCEPAGK